MKLIFFYGLFMDDELLKEKGFNPTLGNVAFVDGYGLRIGERATLVKSENERSYGVVMGLSEEELEKLYSDPSVSDYIPELVEATELNGNTSKVTSYNLPAAMLSGSNSGYADLLSDTAQKVGLPKPYIQEIRTWAR